MAADGETRASSNGLRLLYWILFFLFLLASVQPGAIAAFSSSSSSSSRRVLEPVSPSSSNSQSTKLHSDELRRRSNFTSHQFESSKHEVPSGPNPVAN